MVSKLNRFLKVKFILFKIKNLCNTCYLDCDLDHTFCWQVTELFQIEESLRFSHELKPFTTWKYIIGIV